MNSADQTRQGSSGVEQETHKLLVAGSIPAPATRYVRSNVLVLTYLIQESGN